MYEHYIEEDFKNYYETLDNCKLTDIVKYAVEGGKCLRGFIVKHLIKVLSNGNLDFWEPVVCVELLHSTSLIVDDLPCMDNDVIRRGKPSTFVKYNERQAILTSFYLVSDAFKLLHRSFLKIRPTIEKMNNTKETNNYKLETHLETLYTMCDYWSDLIGKKLIVGQLLDLREDVESLLNIKIPKSKKEEIIMVYKTSSLFSFCFVLGAIYSLNTELDLEEFKQMGYYMGIMYQLMDDYKDKNEGDESNYISSHGYSKSIGLYVECRTNLLLLLEKNSLNSDELLNIVYLMDKKIDYKN